MAAPYGSLVKQPQFGGQQGSIQGYGTAASIQRQPQQRPRNIEYERQQQLRAQQFRQPGSAIPDLTGVSRHQLTQSHKESSDVMQEIDQIEKLVQNLNDGPHQQFKQFLAAKKSKPETDLKLSHYEQALRSRRKLRNESPKGLHHYLLKNLNQALTFRLGGANPQLPNTSEIYPPITNTPTLNNVRLGIAGLTQQEFTAEIVKIMQIAEDQRFISDFVHSKDPNNPNPSRVSTDGKMNNLYENVNARGSNPCIPEELQIQMEKSGKEPFEPAPAQKILIQYYSDESAYVTFLSNQFSFLVRDIRKDSPTRPKELASAILSTVKYHLDRIQAVTYEAFCLDSISVRLQHENHPLSINPAKPFSGESHDSLDNPARGFSGNYQLILEDCPGLPPPVIYIPTAYPDKAPVLTLPHEWNHLPSLRPVATAMLEILGSPTPNTEDSNSLETWPIKSVSEAGLALFRAAKVLASL